jgi:hypothetical protein
MQRSFQTALQVCMIYLPIRKKVIGHQYLNLAVNAALVREVDCSMV